MQSVKSARHCCCKYGVAVGASHCAAVVAIIKTSVRAAMMYFHDQIELFAGQLLSCQLKMICSALALIS